MYTLYKFHFLNGISEINQLFDDILIIWPAPVYIKENASYNYYIIDNCVYLVKSMANSESTWQLFG